MFKMILVLFAVVAVIESKAEAKTIESTGTSLVQDLDHNQSFIEIKGESAKQVFEAMSIDLLTSFDAGENDGVRAVMKIGENINCTQLIELNKAAEYVCDITVENNLQGKVGKGQ